MEMPWRAARPERGSVSAARWLGEPEGDAGADDGAVERRQRSLFRRVQVPGGVVLVGALGQPRRRREQAHGDGQAGVRHRRRPPRPRRRRLGVDRIEVVRGRRRLRPPRRDLRLEAEARVAPGLGCGQPGLEDHARPACAPRARRWRCRAGGASRRPPRTGTAGGRGAGRGRRSAPGAPRGRRGPCRRRRR